jgi:hypothetical protein
MSDFGSAVLRAITWRALIATQTLGALFALLPWLEQWGQPTQPALVFGWTKQALTAMFVMLAALAGDEAVRRGRRVLSAFAAALLFACAGTALAQWCVEAAFAVLDPRPGAQRLLSTFLDVGSFWGTVLLVYLNRQSAARLLARLRAGELARVQAEHRLITSALAATEAQINPAAVLRRLAEVRDLFATSSDDADARLELLIADLRDIVASCARLQREVQTTEGTLDRAG